MRHPVVVATLAVSLLFVACSDQPTEVSPPQARSAPSATVVGVGCPTTPTAAQILTQVNLILPRGPIRTSVIALVTALPSRLQDRIKTAVRDRIFVIQDILLKAFYAGKLTDTSAATFDNVLELIRLLYCYVGLTPPDFPGTSTGSDVVVGVVFPNSPLTTIAVPSQHAAVTIPAGAAPAPTTIVIRILPDTPGPLLTSLDQYPLFYEFSGTTATGPVVFNSFVTAGVCLRDIIEVPDENLRLAHNVGSNFGDVEVLPRAPVVPGVSCADLGGNPGFLSAPTKVGAAAGTPDRWSSVGRALEPLARALLPEPLHATSLALTLPVGGTTKKFSPFGVVDVFSNPGSFTRVSRAVTSEEPLGTTVIRTVHVSSSNGAALAKVPVTFATTTGSLGGSQPVLTDAFGNASVSWTLPSTAGVYTLTATAFAIDNPPGESSDPPSVTPDPYQPDVAFDPSSLAFTVAGSSPPALTALPCSLEGTASSVNSNSPVDVTFVNGTGQIVTVYWLDYSGQRVLYNTVAPGGSYVQPTFVTHPWILIGGDNTCYGIFLPLSTGGTATVGTPIIIQ
jgi:hypothetical protein